MEYITGMVERITYNNSESGFSVIKLKVRGKPDLVTAVGNLASVNVGSILKLSGEWRFDSNYGEQFRVTAYEERIPATIAGIEKYLGSGLIKGVGPVYARKIVSLFKEDTIRVIDEEPDRLENVEGIGPKRLEMIKRTWQDQKEIKNVMLFLQDHGVSTAFAVKIYKTYGNESINTVKSNPYRLADDIWGIGFKTADTIAQKMGFDKNSFERCRSGISYVLNTLSEEGHCFAFRDQLEEKAAEILEIEPDIIQTTLESMIMAQDLVLDDDQAVYLPALYNCETGVARRIDEILSAGSSYKSCDPDHIIENVQKSAGINYDEIQIDAIRTAARAKFMILTGGPGTGKTTTTLGIIRVFQSMGAKILLAAPTGRAAKRMTETTGMESMTIHRLLDYKPPEGYGKNQNNRLDCDVLIIDESSMIDVVLAYNLLKAVPDEAAVLMVGDVDQLPSVGPGNVLRDVMESGRVPVVRLTRIFRQAMNSAIIRNAHLVNKGKPPELIQKKDSDFFFIEEENPERIVDLIKDLCARRLPKYYKVNPIEDIQVLCPMQRGLTGAQNLNQQLQETLNPSPLRIRFGSTEYRLNDKVMQIKNNYDKNTFNGDIGTITRIDLEEKTVGISFDQSEVLYDVTELDEIVLAYATTIHKSQGSEYKIVVAPFTTQHYMMLQRNLLYTCMTRAKKVFVIIGSKKAVAMAVRNNRTEKRNTMLSKRIAKSE